MTRERLIKIGTDVAKAHEELTSLVIAHIQAADQLVAINHGSYSNEAVYEEAYKGIVYAQAKAMTSEIFRQAGIPL